ncbi:M20 metallopeptidase family protein [Cytobacillus purgationiresistens]|uniref:Amidohydrolase n=1 Tax=Cytobacillus purgationiresistens TaxID=863449 RepID=A0ABU0AAD6_9BACI|nr:M20 family metallopeptidase [Cytobacillus purgationiresistens]MDQ0268210.1 amidohydrolase [Cytobacillus purgationiresistens]
MTFTFKGKANKVLDEIVAFRRELHEYPELSGEEVETSLKIQENLRKHDIPFHTGFAKTGVLGMIKGGKQGGIVALRADIDALPITERTGLAFASKVEGKMHACGHDSHTAMLLGAGILLNELKDEIRGTILLVFQPSEEKSPLGGAREMMKDGVFAEYPPDVIIGQHVWPDLPSGQIGVRSGPIMGNSDRFSITVHGSGGHASMPHTAIDAIAVANQVITMIQTIVSRNVDPIQSAVITIGKISGGVAHNVIADEVVLEGTIRTLSNKVKQQVKKRFLEVVNGSISAMGARAEIEYLDGYPATINTPEWADRVKQTAVNMFGEENVPAVAPSMAGEDFGRFLQKYPGVYYWLGSSLGEGQKPLHNPSFMVDEEIFPKGIELMSQLAIDTLAQIRK